MTAEILYFLIKGSELGNLRSNQLPNSRKAEIAKEVISRPILHDTPYSWDWCLNCPHTAQSSEKMLDELEKWANKYFSIVANNRLGIPDGLFSGLGIKYDLQKKLKEFRQQAERDRG